MCPCRSTNSGDCNKKEPGSSSQTSLSLAVCWHVGFFLLLSKTCLYKNIESGLTGKASRRLFEHNCLCFIHKEIEKKQKLLIFIVRMKQCGMALIIYKV